MLCCQPYFLSIFHNKPCDLYHPLRTQISIPFDKFPFPVADETYILSKKFTIIDFRQKLKISAENLLAQDDQPTLFQQSRLFTGNQNTQFAPITQKKYFLRQQILVFDILSAPDCRVSLSTWSFKYEVPLRQQNQTIENTTKIDRSKWLTRQKIDGSTIIFSQSLSIAHYFEQQLRSGCPDPLPHKFYRNEGTLCRLF